MLSHLQPIQKDAIFELNNQFNQDPNPNKINLGVGIYLDNHKQPYVHPVIQKAAQEIQTNNFNYNTIQGHKGFLEESLKFLFPESLQDQLAIQAISGGTHGCALISKLLLQNSIQNLILPVPTWGNHHKIFQDHATTNINHLNENHQPNFEEYKLAIENAQLQTAILIHGGQAHNPTGQNLNLQQLKTISELANQHQVFIILDFAYLGLSEDLETDLQYLHQLNNDTENITSIISFSKNATLYEHRTGILTIKSKNKSALESHLQRLVRQTISQPSGYGQKIMHNILKNHKQEWINQLQQMNQSIQTRRQTFFAEFPDFPETIKNSKGMFTLLPFTKEKINSLKKDHSIYIPLNGRINFGSLTQNDIKILKEVI